MRGKTIKLFLMEGTATGRIKCTMANWTGVVYKLPRTSLNLCKDRDDLKKSGIYFLFGVDDKTRKNIVYVGQASTRKNGEGILYRLLEHNRNRTEEKDFWAEAIVITTSDNSLGATEISYLENRFCGLARDAKSYVVKNGNEPNQWNITEEKENELEDFVDNSCDIMGVLGQKVFECTDEIKIVKTVDPLIVPTESILQFYSSSIIAFGKKTLDGFVILKGSAIARKIQKSCPKATINARVKYESKIDNNNLITEDLSFPSPSAAASFVGGSSLSGNIAWKTSEGKTLSDLKK